MLSTLLSDDGDDTCKVEFMSVPVAVPESAMVPAPAAEYVHVNDALPPPPATVAFAGFGPLR